MSTCSSLESITFFFWVCLRNFLEVFSSAPPLWSCKIISAYSANSRVAVYDTVGERPAGKTRAEQMDGSKSGTHALILHPVRRSGGTRRSFHRYTPAFLNANGQRSQVSRGAGWGFPLYKHCWKRGQCFFLAVNHGGLQK